ncbi:MAG: FeoA domain-containing protein [Thermodesulfobacteriota bacterium]|nr:FeoA domain-containing protein [Thermodesulfobacteriota bacterium]
MKKTDCKFSQQPGVECIIHSLGSDEKIAQRLAQMGVLPGARLHIVRLAPLGTTIEVSVDGGQCFAMRNDELATLDCEIVATPLTAVDGPSHTTYRIRRLAGGRRFRQRMGAQGIEPGRLIKILDQTGPPIRVQCLDQEEIVKLGRGEAEKIIVKVTGG